MRICHVSWEFPPIVYGGLGRHVFAVAKEQARAGHDVVVISHVGIEADDGQARPREDVVEGVRVVRVVRDAPFVPFEPETLLGWTAGLSSAMTRTGLDVAREWRAEVIHSHDWLTAHAGSVLSDSLDVPWVQTVHATEAGRHQGWLPSPLSKAIHSIERWSVHAADRVVVCSQHMKWEVDRLFDQPEAMVIPNGVDASAGLVDAALRGEVRAKYPGLLIVHTGRLEWEKGAHTIIEALPRLRRVHPDVQCVIAGRGSQRDALVDLAKRKKVASRVHFEGWLPEPRLRALVAAADVAIVPSIYEPFGIVALEAAVVGTPVVAARAGGLAEFLDDDRHGWGFIAGDAGDLTRAVQACIDNPDESKKRAMAARAHVHSDHSWAAIADRTVVAYRCQPTGERSREKFSATASDRNLLFDVQ